MITKKSTIKTEAIYTDDNQHRLLLRKIWDNTLPTLSIIMLSPSSSNEVRIDMTTMYIINNASEQGFGGVEILNLFSKLNCESFGTCSENDEQILKSCQKADKVLLAWGKGHTNNKQVIQRIEEVMQLLKPYKNKLFEISDGVDTGFHPLGRTVRLLWHLVEYKAKQEQ